MPQQVEYLLSVANLRPWQQPWRIPVTIVATAVVGGAVTEGAALEQSIGGVETLFKENASVVKANADAAFKTAGLSANEYMSQVTSFFCITFEQLGW